MIYLYPTLTPSELLDCDGLPSLIAELLRDCRSLCMDGRLSEAERRALDAVDASREAGAQIAHGVGLVHLGDVHREMGRLGPALADYQEAHRIFQRQASRYQRYNEAITAYGLGLVHQLLGNDIDALKWYQQADGLLERVKDDWVAVNALDRVATCTRVQRWTKALSECLADERTRADGNPFTDIWVPTILSDADETAFAIAKFKVDKYAILKKLEIKGVPFRMQPVKGRQRAFSPECQYYARPIPDEACGTLDAEEGDYALVEQEREVDREVDKEGPAVLETLGGPQFGRFTRDAEGQIVFDRPGATPIVIGGEDIEDLRVGYITALLKPA